MAENDVNFNTPTATYSAKREYAPISEFSDFIGLKDTFQADSTMGLAEKKISGESFKGVVNILNPEGEHIATVTVESKYPGIYPNMLGGINTDFAERVLSDGCTAVENTDKRNWKMTLSGETGDGDTFRLAVDESFCTLSGYHLEATLQTFETWADTQPELSAAPAA